MSRCNCPCCQVYGPIPQDYEITSAERRRIAKEAKQAMDRFKREEPEEYKKLCDSLAALTSGKK